MLNNSRSEIKLLVHNYENELARLATSAVEIKALTAFLTEGGLRWLPENKAPHAEFIVGVDLGITSPQAIKSLQRQGACVRIFRQPGKMFHPKAIYLRTEEKESLIVGSNNLTSGGISSNHEVSLVIIRNVWNESAFRDFLGYFECLKIHDCCSIPDEQFFEAYKPTDIARHLADQLQAQKKVPLLPPNLSTSTIDNISTLRDFIRLLAEEFPNLERRRGQTVKGHPLKRLNDEEFLPLFRDIVSTVSQGRLDAHSQLNIGGTWYRIPNILAVNKAREPWETTNNRGRLILQIHFSADFSAVFFSIVLQYNLPRSVAGSEMPTQVDQRLQNLLEYVEDSSTKAKLDLPVFRHWNYKDVVLWGKPLMSFEYSLGSLPDNKTLYSDLAFLANVINGASAIP